MTTRTDSVDARARALVAEHTADRAKARGKLQRPDLHPLERRIAECTVKRTTEWLADLARQGYTEESPDA